MPLFDLVSPKLFGPLAGPNRTYYAELLLLLWEECRRAADYSLLRAEAVSRAEEYFAALAKPVTLDPDGSDPEAAQPTRDPHLLALGFLLRLRRTGWLTEQPGGFEQEPRIAFTPELAPLLDGLDAIVHPPVVTYTGKLYKAWRLLAEMGAEAAPYENVLREVAADLAELNRSLRGLNASIGHYIDRLTRNRTPEQVLELFGQYEEQVVAAAYHRFKTSDNLFNYRSALEEGLDQCETVYLRALALDYARVEGCAPTQAAAAVRELVQQLRDELEQMGELVRQIDRSHLRYRKRAVQRAQFLLLSDRSAQGHATALLRAYARDIHTQEDLWEPDDSPLARRVQLWPAAVFGADPCTPRRRSAPPPRWSRWRTAAWTPCSWPKSSSFCWTTPAVLLPRRTWTLWHAGHWPPGGRWPPASLPRKTPVTLPGSSACTPIPARPGAATRCSPWGCGCSRRASGLRIFC